MALGDGRRDRAVTRRRRRRAAASSLRRPTPRPRPGRPDRRRPGAPRSASDPRPHARRRPLVHPKALVARPVADPVVRGESLPLGARDRRLAALDRVEADELGEPVVARGPGLDAPAGLRRRRRGGLASDRVEEAVPESDVGLLLLGVAAQLGALVRGADGDGGAEVAIAAVAWRSGRSRRPAPRGSARRPTSAVEGVLEHVPARGPARSSARRRCSRPSSVAGRGRAVDRCRYRQLGDGMSMGRPG